MKEQNDNVETNFLFDDRRIWHNSIYKRYRLWWESPVDHPDTTLDTRTHLSTQRHWYNDLFHHTIQAPQYIRPDSLSITLSIRHSPRPTCLQRRQYLSLQKEPVLPSDPSTSPLSYLFLCFVRIKRKKMAIESSHRSRVVCIPVRLFHFKTSKIPEGCIIRDPNRYSFRHHSYIRGKGVLTIHGLCERKRTKYTMLLMYGAFTTIHRNPSTIAQVAGYKPLSWLGHVRGDSAAISRHDVIIYQINTRAVHIFLPTKRQYIIAYVIGTFACWAATNTPITCGRVPSVPRHEIPSGANATAQPMKCEGRNEKHVKDEMGGTFAVFMHSVTYLCPQNWRDLYGNPTKNTYVSDWVRAKYWDRTGYTTLKRKTVYHHYDTQHEAVVLDLWSKRDAT